MKKIADIRATSGQTDDQTWRTYTPEEIIGFASSIASADRHPFSPGGPVHPTPEVGSLRELGGKNGRRPVKVRMTTDELTSDDAIPENIELFAPDSKKRQAPKNKGS